METILTVLGPVSQVRTELMEDPQNTNFAHTAIGVYAIHASKDALISTQFIHTFELVFSADQAYHAFSETGLGIRKPFIRQALYQNREGPSELSILL
jgi:hypothetical protein